MRLRWVLLVVLAIPVVDVLLLVPLAGEIGLSTTVLVVVLTGLVGMLIVRAEGQATLRRIIGALQRGQLPADALIDGGLLIAAGALLLTPGIVTDLIGFLVTVPVTRPVFRTLVRRVGIDPVLRTQTVGFHQDEEEDEVIDVDGGDAP
jgi:Protein affecting phage T7 exclusion by the F plasmid